MKDAFVRPFKVIYAIKNLLPQNIQLLAWWYFDFLHVFEVLQLRCFRTDFKY